VSRERLTLEHSKGILDGIDQRPTQFEQLATRASRKDDAPHGSLARPTLGQLAAQVGKRDRFVTRDLRDTGLDRGDRLGVRENLCGLFERFVLVDRDQRCRRSAVTRYKHVIPTIGDIAKKLTELASELANGNGLRHGDIVPDCVHKSSPPNHQALIGNHENSLSTSPKPIVGPNAAESYSGS
jgi:hypothetical protein